MSVFFKKIKSVATIFFLSFGVKRTIQFSFILIAFFTITGVALSQASISNSISSIDLSISPSNPRAGDSVVITVSSDLLDLNSSKIVWYIDGIARKDTSNKSITIKANGGGGTTAIKVVVETQDGIIKEASTEISPAGVDLVIEPISYVMPFYKGKPYLLGQGTVKVVAMPDIKINGSKIMSENLTFKWLKEGIVWGSNSGKGNDSIILSSTIPVRDMSIGVQVLDSSGNVLAESSKLIIINTPQILFYENSPLYGILFNKAITGSYYLGTREELDVIAKPFSFNFFEDAPSQSNYAWYVNGNYIVPNGKPNVLILKQTGVGLKGTASISLDLKNADKINQYATDGFSVQFGQ